MKIQILKLAPFKDHRGEFVQLYSSKDFGCSFVEDDISVNRKGVVRGIHGDGKTSKLITCLFGAIFLVLVNTKTGRVSTLTLKDKERLQVFVPKGYGLGYQALTDNTIVHYKQTNGYGEEQFTLPWDRQGVEWPLKEAILSERDRNAT